MQMKEVDVMNVKKFPGAVFMVCLAFFLTIFSSAEIKAEEINYKEAVYDLTEGGTQKFVFEDEAGQEIYVTIAEVSQGKNVRIADKTYAVKYTNPLQWTAGYNVIVKSNSIRSVNSPYVDTVLGRASNGTLKKESSKQATYYFSYTIGGITANIGIRTEINGTEMKVYKI